MQSFLSRITIIRISAIVLTCLSLWINYFVITGDRDFQKASKEKLYLINNHIQLKDCSENQEALLKNFAVAIYKNILAKTIECIKNNEAKMPSIRFFYSEDISQNILAYQDNLAMIESTLFREPKISQEIDFLLEDYQMAFSYADDESLINFKSILFIYLLFDKYSYWFFINLLLILGTLNFILIEEENYDEEQYE
jgi:hypothetical protein